MKSLILAALTVFIIQPLSAASSGNVRLSLEERPVRNYAFGRPFLKIEVLDDGRVLSTTCENVEMENSQCFERQLDLLKASEVEAIDELIQGAQAGSIQLPNPGALHCLAMPTHSFSYTANNGAILLKAGTAPCGSITNNTSTEAQLLIEKLQNLATKFRRN